jgi:hypothetical protein
MNPLKDNVMTTHTCVSCDSVFDTLTRGPYPNGDSNADVDRHLAACHECRQLAEALRPATNLFHEVMTKELTADLPVFRSKLPNIQVRTEPVAPTGRFRVQPRLAVSAACLLIGCAVGFGLRNDSAAHDNDSIGGPNLAYMAVARLVELPFSEKCYPQIAMAHHRTEDQLKSELDCCTRCHTSPRGGGVAVDPGWTTTIASSCLACHSMAQL